MIIAKNDNTPITVGSSIKKKDLYPSPENNFGGKPVQIDTALVLALDDIVRYYGGGKVRIHGTVRTKYHNDRLKPNPGAKYSRHLTGEAIDFELLDKKAQNQFQKDIYLYQTVISNRYIYYLIKRFGVNGFGIYPNFTHIDIRETLTIWNKAGDLESEASIQSDAQHIDAKNKVEINIPPSKDYYSHIHQNSSDNTVSLYLKDVNSFAKAMYGKPKEFCEYKGDNGTTNLQSIWSNYTEEQKNRFSSDYKKLTDQITDLKKNKGSQSDIDAKVNKKREFIPTYESKYDYEINVGTTLYVPKNKANVDIFAADGSGIFLKQQSIGLFLNEEFQAIANDPDYRKIETLGLNSNSMDLTFLHLNCSVWIYIRALDTVFNVTPFIINLSTTVGATGEFSFSLNDISSMSDISKYGASYYNYFQKVRDGKYNISYWQKYIQQNDVVWVRYEQLQIEKDRNEEIGLIIPKSEIPEKIYDMIGLVDENREQYQANNNTPSVNISGRDLTKMLLEDGAYFYPFALVSGGKDFFLNYDSEDKVFKRLFDGSYQSLLTMGYKSIRNSLGFVFNQLSNTGLFPKENDLFKYYKSSKSPLDVNNTDRVTKSYGLEKEEKNIRYLEKTDVNGVWQIIRLLVDHQLDDRMLANGEITNPNGNLFELIQKICDPNFVEFYGDTTGDLFTFLVRQPPLNRKSINEYFDNNLVVEIGSEIVSNVNLGWETQFSTLYEIKPMDGLFGSSLTSAAYTPMVYFEEYSNVFGIHKKSVCDNYINYKGLVGNGELQDTEQFRAMVIEDFRFIIETNSILPFTRKGSITLRVGDRRIKKGNWIYFKPTNEIFYVTSVTNSLSANGSSIDRTTDLSVERGMVRDYVLGEGVVIEPTMSGADFTFMPTETTMSSRYINYFNIINLDQIQDKLNVSLKDGKLQLRKGAINLVDKENFDFFVNRKQM